MTYLLDTNACVHSLRRRGNRLVRQRLGSRLPGDIVLCSVVVAELFFGAEGSSNPVGGRQQAEAFAAAYRSLPFEDAAARVYARIRHNLESRGLPIGENDYMIAAITLANNLILVTHNTKEFSRVPGLVIEDWEIP